MAQAAPASALPQLEQNRPDAGSPQDGQGMVMDSKVIVEQSDSRAVSQSDGIERSRLSTGQSILFS